MSRLTGAPNGASLTLRPVETRADRETFIRLPWSVYRDDPAWIPPLLMERREHLDPRKNPFFENAQAQFWLALRDGHPVGRISAQVNRAYLARYNDATGHFGMLEAEDDPETFRALLAAAEGWLRQQGMRRVMGPFNLSINEESGLLVEGFDRPPSMLMGHAPPYYAAHLEALGYAKAKDLICYWYDAKTEPPASVGYMLHKAARSAQMTVRPIDMRRYEEDLAVIIDIFNDAWSDNWGFVPMSQSELKHMAKALKPIVRPEFIAIAELNGTPAAMAISLPNVNEAIADLNGRLLPLGWLKLLWRLKVKTTKSARMPLMGVRKAYHSSRLGAALAIGVIDSVRRAQVAVGTEGGELSWILEDNLRMRRMIEQMGGIAYKTYRVYQRGLD
ncbi:dATP pyrophosphohydrolase [Pelagibius sp. 7325]|uniref:dATP pyrophosphohydrolase n=1 Tax=Pelagibius sp. 7325 TaxID=3131994 RepID=UPI0030ED0239